MKQHHHVSRKLLVLAILALCLMAFLASCGECDHQLGEWTVSEKPSCEAAGARTRSCSACGETQSEPLAASGHHFDTYVSNGDATCLSDMTETATCAHCDKTDTRTVANSKNTAKHVKTELRYEVGEGESHKAIYACCGAVAETAAHRWDAGTTDPTNTQNTLYTCQDCHATKSVPPAAHVHSAQKIEATPAGCSTFGNIEHWYCQGCNTRFTDATLAQIITETETKLSPAHTSAEFVYAPHATNPNLHEKKHACCGAVVETVAHQYVSAGNHPATCTQNGYTVWRCVCNATYNADNAVATGHNVEFWDLDHEVLKAGSTCTYTQTYTGSCFTCSQSVEKSVEIIRHSYVATVTAHPTCCEAGSKTYACACGATPAEATVTINATPDAHAWNDGVTENGVTTYSCENGCGKTKTAVVYTQPTQNVDKSVLENNEIVLGGVSLKLDPTTLGLLEDDPDKKVTVTANPVDNRDDLINSLPEALRGQITASTPIYDFSLSQGGTPISQFGDGRITITLPYELPVGADADCVAVWYVNDLGQLSFYEATYYEVEGEGFVIFEASHFSTYLPGVAPSEDACRLYGHNYDEKTTAPTCDQKGYTEYHCQRCGESKIDDVTEVLGHAYDAGTGTASTCTVAGEMTYSCTRVGCNHTLKKTLATAPHDWQYVESESTSVSCTVDGVTVSRCRNDGCNEKKTEITSAWGSHDLYDASAVLAPGATLCTDGVVVTVKCYNCDHTETKTYTDSHIRIDKFSYDGLGYVTIPETQIKLGAYLQSAGISYTDEPYVTLTHGCFCGALKDRVSMFNGTDQSGSELFSGMVEFSAMSPYEQDLIMQTMPTMIGWDPISGPIESPVFKIRFQSVINRVGCHETYSVIIQIGYDETAQTAAETLTYVLYAEDRHSSVKKTATLDDPSKTCFENCPVVNSTLVYGIHVTETCADCGTVLNTFDTAVTSSSSHYFCHAETYNHYENENDTDYGVRVNINECPCGQIEYQVYSGDCSFTRTTSGDTTIYTCENCGYIYAEKLAEIEDRENCRYTYTKYLYLDCQSASDVTDCEKTVICRLIDEARHYSVTNENNQETPTPTENPCRYHYYSKNTCNECGKITYSVDGYTMDHDEITSTSKDSHGNVTTTVTCRAEGCGYSSITVTDKDGNALREYRSEKDYSRGELRVSLVTRKMIGGAARPTLERDEYYSADGTQLLRWSQWIYTYQSDSEKGCICKTTYSNHAGDDSVSESTYCDFEEHYEQILSCTQDGYSYDVCSTCGYISYTYYEKSRGHRYYNGSCEGCGIPCTHDYQDGVCSVCHLSCNHDYNDDSVCTECGMTCPHGYFNEGVCVYCDMVCAHDYHDGTCSVCGMACDHDYNSNSVCTVCGITCPHSFSDGVCSDCELICTHDYQNGSCTVCYKTCDHNYVNDVCTVCGKVCTHEFYYDGVCNECNKECDHNYQDSICTVCNKNCGHNWTEGVCADCDKVCSHEFYYDGVCGECYQVCEHNYQDGWCSVCSKTCWHEFWSEGVCSECQMECPHSFSSEGFCGSCGVMCDHTYENGTCTVCNKECYHTWVESVCSECEMECPHGYYDNGICTRCGTPCTHDYQDGCCTVCTLPCGHDWVEGTCSVCRTECSHGYYDSGVCFDCGMVCDHNYQDGMCAVCQTICSHESYSNGTCTECGITCPHTFYDGTCSVCGTACPHDGYVTDDTCGMCGTTVI